MLVVGSNLRKDHPLFAQRIRQAVRKGAAVHGSACRARRLGHAVARQSLPAAERVGCRRWPTWRPRWPRTRGVCARCRPRRATRPKAIAKSLLGGERKAILLGNAAAHHAKAAELLALANWIGEQTGATVGYLTEAANTVGAQLVGALPGRGRPECRADAVGA